MENLFEVKSNTSKTELRVWAKEMRKSLNFADLSRASVRRILDLDEYKQAKNIMIYYPMQAEINLLALLKDENKKFFLPKISGNNLLCCPFENDFELCLSCFKTKEPLTNAVEKSLIDLIIVPALVMDKNHYRLGYGGGFYDRFLLGLDAKTLVCIPTSLVVDTIYPESHDVKIDKIIQV